MADQEQTTIWVDANGRTRATYIRTAAGAATIVADLVALSHADWQRSWAGDVLVNGAPSTSTGDYQNVADYAVLVYQTAVGTQVYLTLVAPQSGIFLADQETVDPTAIAVLNTDVIGSLEDGAGNVVTAYVGGFRRRSGREYQ